MQEVTHSGWPETVSDFQPQIDWWNPTVVSQRVSGIESTWRMAGVSTVSVPQTDAQYIEQLYTLQRWYLFRGDRLKTLRFLERYPFLVPLLVEAYRNIQRCFPLSLVYLTVISDPEEFGTDQLTAFIATNLEPEKAVDALSNFDKTWWLKAVKRTQGKFCITLEFQ